MNLRFSFDATNIYISHFHLAAVSRSRYPLGSFVPYPTRRRPHTTKALAPMCPLGRHEPPSANHEPCSVVSVIVVGPSRQRVLPTWQSSNSSLLVAPTPQHPCPTTPKPSRNSGSSPSQATPKPLSNLTSS